MYSWTFKNGVAVNAIAVDSFPDGSDWCRFDVLYNGNKIGAIYPPNADWHLDVVMSLNNGYEPITGGWEDGRGNICTINGWPY